jgi:hypothetical protein
LITGDVVAQEFAAGRTRIAAAPAECVITPAAWTKAFELGVTFDRSASPTPAAKPDATPTQGRSTREVDASGIVVVRGESVELTPFAAAGAGKKVGMADLVYTMYRGRLVARREGGEIELTAILADITHPVAKDAAA